MRAGVERVADVVGLDVEVVGVGVVEGGADVLPVVGQRGRDLLLGGDEHGGVRGEVEERVEAVDRQQLGDVGAVLGVRERGDLGRLAVLGGQLGRRARSRPRRVSPSERWVKVENQRSDSISMSKRSTRTARSSVAG